VILPVPPPHHPNTPRSPILLLLTLSCTPHANHTLWRQVPYDDIAATCDLANETGGHPLAPNGDLSLSADCAALLGDAFGVDWSDFDEEPHNIHDPDSALESVLGGLLLSIGASGVTIDEALTADAPSTLSDQLTGLAAREGLSGGDEMGRLWYEHLSRAFHTIQYKPELDALAYFGGNQLVIGDVGNTISDDPAILPIADNAMPFLEVAVILLHESGHNVYGGHTDCPNNDGRCDASREGAYGVGVWWGHLWLQANLDSLEWYTCDDAAERVESSCAVIIDDDGWAACEVSALRERCWAILVDDDR